MNFYVFCRRYILKKYIGRPIDRIKYRLFFKRILYNYNPRCVKTNEHALVYGKTDFMFRGNSLRKTASLTSLMVKITADILNEQGYIVDIFDRGICVEKLKKKYSVYVGGCNGGSGDYFSNFFQLMSSQTVKIAFSTGANNRVTKENFEKRKTNFLKRRLRQDIDTIERVTSVFHDKALSECHAMLYTGKTFVPESYSSFDMPKYRITTPTELNVIPELQCRHKVKNKVLYLAGSGMLHKGLDLILEAFGKNENGELYVCSATEEMALIKEYKELLFERSNIHYLGRVDVNSSEFTNIAISCQFIISGSCSEGDPKSIALGMQFGLIPIATYYSDTSFEHAIIIEGENVADVEEALNKAFKMNLEERNNLSRKAYNEGLRHTLQTYETDLRNALVKIISE